MKVVVVGNNVAGTFSAQNVRFLNEDVDIEIYTQEKYPFSMKEASELESPAWGQIQ